MVFPVWNSFHIEVMIYSPDINRIFKLANQNVSFNVNGVFYHKITGADGLASFLFLFS